MSNESTICDQIEEIRKRTIAILEALNAKAITFQLPKVHETVADYRLKLADNTYRVLVLGEAIRGKSSFINIGNFRRADFRWSGPEPIEYFILGITRLRPSIRA